MKLSLLITTALVAVVYSQRPVFGPVDIPKLASQCKTGVKCRFFPCSTLPIIFFTEPGKTSFPTLCLRNQNIGAIFSIGEPMVKEQTRPGAGGRTLTKVSEWRPAGLSPNFGADVFEPGSIPGVDNSGLTRKYSRGNQNSFMHGTCFVVPVREYVLIRSNGKQVSKKTNKAKDCFAFVANTPPVVFELQWLDTGDDLDLSVEEPDGTIVDYINPRSTCGRLNGGDKNIDGCELKKEEREKIEYFRSCRGFQTGTYKATVRHTTNCQEGLTRYEIRVLVDGRVADRKSGTSNGDLGEVIDTLTFTI